MLTKVSNTTPVTLFTEPCVKFLKQQAVSLNLAVNIYYPSLPEKPIVVMTWKGTQPELPTIVLNSHMDVVPVYEDAWSHPPFGAEIDNDGRIFARGTQDTKGQGMSYLGAIRLLKDQGFQPKRTLHIMYVPDEEIGGFHGMKAFVETQDFTNLNIGFVIDEGAVSPMDPFYVFYQEKTRWAPTFKAKGEPGHGSLLVPKTAGEGFSEVIDKVMAYREQELQRLETGTPWGNVTTINLTGVKGGQQTNVLPAELSATFDMRLGPQEDLDEFLNMLNRYIEESGGNIELTFSQKDIKSPPTILDDSDPFWLSVQSALFELNSVTDLNVLPGVSDIRFIRSKGYRGISFLPMNHTPILAHADNEYIYASLYLQAIKNFARIIENLTAV